MPTSVYETIPMKTSAKPRRDEIWQSIKDAALKKHPETGEPLRRVIAAGAGILTSASSSPASHCHTSSCGCAR